MVPEGWKTEKLGDHIKLSSGDTKPENMEKEMSAMSPYPVFGGNNVMGFSNSYNSEGSVILIGRVGEYCGVTRYVSQRCWITDNALFTKEISPDLHAEFLVSKLKYLDLSRLRNKGGQPLVSQKPIYGLKLPLPPLPEQKKIAQILSTWDQAITATERLLENSQQRKKGLMQQLLTGKKRLPGFEGEWEELPLLKLADYVKGYTYKSNEYSEVPTDTGFLTLKSLLRGGGYSKEGLKYLKTEIDDKFLVKEGDIVFAVTDITRNAEIVGAPLLVPDLRLPQVAISMDMVKLVVKQGVVPKFLYYALKRSPARNFMRSRASGSTVLHLDVRGSKKLRLPIPKDTREQEAISEVLTIADQEIEALSQRLVWLKHEKKALMQQLLTGKRRVQVDTEAA